MEELLIEKLEAVQELKSFTEEIMLISLKTDYDKLNSMIDDRQVNMEKINIINEKLNKLAENNNYSESNKIKLLRKEIRNLLKDITQMDNLIRKNINSELNDIRKKLNQPDNYAKTLNVKA